MGKLDIPIPLAGGKDGTSRVECSCYSVDINGTCIKVPRTLRGKFSGPFSRNQRNITVCWRFHYAAMGVGCFSKRHFFANFGAERTISQASN